MSGPRAPRLPFGRSIMDTPPARPPAAPPPPVAPARRRRRPFLILLLVSLVGAGAVAGWWRTRARPAVPPAVPERLRPEATAAITGARNEVVKNPASGPAWGVLGLNFTAHGLDDQAAECFREAHRLAPDSDRWPYLLALYYQTDGRDP